MRWADLDLLGHVNNVVYVDYLQEARVDMMRTHGPTARGALAEGTVVVRHEVSYLAPLTLRLPAGRRSSAGSPRSGPPRSRGLRDLPRAPDGPTARGRRVYLRATTVLTPYVFSTERPRRLTEAERETLAVFLEPAERRAAHPPVRRVRPEAASHYPVHVRFSDVDVYGHVNNVKYFEYFQEARIPDDRGLWEGLDPISIVVAQTDVDYRVPILFRHEPYDAWSWVVAGRHPLRDDRVADRRRRHGPVPRARDHRLLRPGDAALDRAAGALPRPAADPAARLSVTRAC